MTLRGPFALTELDILAYADDRLEPERRSEVERLLARRPDLAARIDAMRRVNEAIRRRFDPVFDEPVPDRLKACLDADRRLVPGAGKVAAVAAVIAMAFIAWPLSRTGREAGPDLAQFLRAAEATQMAAAAPADSAPPLGAALEGQPFDAGGVASVPELMPDLSAWGFELVGRSVAEVEGRPALAMTFRDASENALTLFVRPRWQEEEPSFNAATIEDNAVVSWNEGPLTWVLAGTADEQDLVAFARSISAMRGEPDSPAAPVPVQNALDLHLSPAQAAAGSP